MLHVLGFDRLAVVAGDLYLAEDPAPAPPGPAGDAERFHRLASRLARSAGGPGPGVPVAGQDGPERGVRLEVRVLDRLAPAGPATSAARPISLGRAVWRVDLLESVDHPASLDRAHYHPRFTGWAPAGRRYDAGLTADPLGWLGDRLADPAGVLTEAGVAAMVSGADLADLATAVPEILSAVRRLLDGVVAGRLARAPAGADERREPGGVRIGWL